MGVKSSLRHHGAHDRFLDFYDDSFADAYRYAGRLCGGDREAAEDLVQDGYASLLRRLRGDSGAVLQVGYLITTIRNRFLDNLRHDRREAGRLRLLAAGHQDSGANDDHGPTRVQSRLASLPERDRIALVLRYVDDLPVPEVAQTMGITVHAAESLLARARTRLRGEDIRHA